MPCTANRSATPGASSTSTFTSFSSPARSRASCSSAGLTIRHGPHHGAHRSTSTGTFERSATSSKVTSSASAIQGSGSWHCAHVGVPLALAGTRFFRPQLGQGTTWLSLISRTSWPLPAPYPSRRRCGAYAEHVLVGRGRHLDALRAVVDGGGLASVTGPFGIGKSALAAALVGERPAALVGQGLPALSGHAYHPLLHALGWGPRAVEPSAMASQVRDRLVGSDVLVLEDLQWADPGTFEVLVGLVGAAPIVVTLQSGESGTDRARRLLRSLGAREIALPPLDADAVDEIVAHLRPDLLRGERARIVEQSDGNPLAATVLAHAEGAEGPGDTARRGRRAEPGVTVAAYVGRRSAPARRSLALLGVASGPVDRRRLPAVLELERAGLVERRSGGVLPCNRLVARAALEHLADDERRDVLRRAASLPGTAEVARAELLERAGEHAAALEVAEVLAAGPILRSEQARALLVAARAATELCRSEDGPRVAAERASELSVRAAAALNDCNDHDAAAEVLGEVDDHTGPRRDAAVLEALRAAVGRGDRTYAEHVVATTAAALDGLPAQVARRAGALRSMVDRWRGERSEHDDLPALARAHLEVARGGTERSHAAMLVAVTAYGRDVGTMEEWFRVARAEAARDGELSSELSAARNLVMVKMAVGRIAEGRELARECTARAEAAAEAGWALEFRTLDVLGRYYDDGDQDEVLSWLSYVRTAPVRLETRAYSANALATALADRGDARRSAEVLAPLARAGPDGGLRSDRAGDRLLGSRAARLDPRRPRRGGAACQLGDRADPGGVPHPRRHPGGVALGGVRAGRADHGADALRRVHGVRLARGACARPARRGRAAPRRRRVRRGRGVVATDPAARLAPVPLGRWPRARRRG